MSLDDLGFLIFILLSLVLGYFPFFLTPSNPELLDAWSAAALVFIKVRNSSNPYLELLGRTVIGIKHRT